MRQNLTRKLIAAHLVEGAMTPGAEIAIGIDHALVHDSTGVLALLAFEALGIPQVRVDRAVAYIDHNTLQMGCQNRNDHRFLASAARKFGLHFSPAGNGICHQVNLEHFSRPGGALLGADSHTTTAGAVGMLAIGAGGLDVALALAGRPFYLTMPRVMRIDLRGKLPAWSSAKDLALEILHRLKVSGGRGSILEFTGSGVATLSIPDRATVANMSIETGATTAVFPSDAVTREFFQMRRRLPDYRPLAADPGADYDEEQIIDLAAIPPLVAQPHSPDNVCPVSDIAGIPLDQVAIGTCTNASLDDLLMAARVLKGKRVPANLSLVVVPGSRQVLGALIDQNGLGSLIDAGARLMESACGFCIGVGHAPGSGEVSLRTANRNFSGRCGTADAEVYLASAETAAASAVTGRLTDPRELGDVPVKAIPLPYRQACDLVQPAGGENPPTDLQRGVDIAPLPSLAVLPSDLEARLLLCLKDDVSTDDIMPVKGVVTNLKSNIPAMAEYVFSDLAPDFAQKARQAGCVVVIAGRNYGQGSSREQAALAPRYLGLSAVVAVSYARIHLANLINFGILPLVFVDPDQRSRFREEDLLRLADVRAIVERGDAPVLENVTQGFSIPVKLDASERQRRILLAGGALNHARERL